MQKQLSNAQEKLERAQQHAEDKRLAGQQTIERLQREYEEMVLDRRDNEKQVEELRSKANEFERQVRSSSKCWGTEAYHNPQMAEHLRSCEAELNELLTEYWKQRHETGVFLYLLSHFARH